MTEFNDSGNIDMPSQIQIPNNPSRVDLMSTHIWRLANSLNPSKTFFTTLGLQVLSALNTGSDYSLNDLLLPAIMATGAGICNVVQDFRAGEIWHDIGQHGSLWFKHYRGRTKKFDNGFALHSGDRIGEIKLLRNREYFDGLHHSQASKLLLRDFLRSMIPYSSTDCNPSGNC